MMQSIQQLKFLRSTLSRLIFLGSAVTASLVLSACGGGGGGGGGDPLVAEAVVTVVDPGEVLENGTQMLFTVHLDKAVQRGLSVTFSTSSTAKNGFNSTGSATGGGSCTGTVDFINASGSVVSIPVGVNTINLTVAVCADGGFEPNETFNLTWSSAGAAGATILGTIVNDDAGGLNGTGSTTLMGGLAAFGRDVNITTKDNADGALGFSFDKTNVACTLDKVTGLTWQKTWTTNQTFAQATTLAQNSNACGLGWRVPTVNELLSLVNINVPLPGTVNADAMTDVAEVMTGDFWSSEQVANATNNAWIMSAANGAAVSFVSKNLVGATQAVRLVSGTSTLSTCNTSGRYTNFGDGTVEDQQTGLMWKQCAEGASGAQCATGAPTSFATADAMGQQVILVNGSPGSLGMGYANWRIPTIKELASLVDRCTTTPLNLAIDSSIFPGNGSQSYISASPDATTAGQFWYVDFAQGTIAVASPANKYLRLVRAGQ